MAITPGIYRLKNPKTGTYLDGGRPLQVVGHQLHTDPDEVDHQKWEVYQLPNNQGYEIKNVYSKGYLFVASTADQTPVQTKPSQKTLWALNEAANGAFTIIVKGTDATVKVGGTANMSGVFLTTSVVPDDEKWVPERLGDLPVDPYKQPDPKQPDPKQPDPKQPETPKVPTFPYDTNGQPIVAGRRYTLKNVGLYNAMEIIHAAKSPGSPVGGAVGNGRPEQMWDLIAFGNRYLFRNVDSGLYLGHYPSTKAGDNVPALAHNTQVGWELRPASPKGNYMVYGGTSFVLGLAGSQAGARVFIQNQGTSDNQKWEFAPS